MQVWDAPKGVGPSGITATPDGAIYYVSLAGSFLGKPDLDTGETTVIEPKTAKAGTRRVWSDSKGRLWVSEWNAGNLSVYDPASQSWEVYRLPVTRRTLMPSMSTARTRCGSAISVPTQFLSSILTARASRASRATGLVPQYASLTGAKAKCGVRSPAPTASW
jgi:hypothetical protein